MKYSRQEQLIQILKQKKDWITGADLAATLNVSERSIRNYVRSINAEQDNLIEASRNGYRIIKMPTTPIREDETVKRIRYILSRLLTERNGVSAFDLAEAMYVSESTVINYLIPQIRDLAATSNLKVTSKNFTFMLEGDPADIRRLVVKMVSTQTDSFLKIVQNLSSYFPDFDTSQAVSVICEQCQGSSLSINEFAFRNLLIHLLVMLVSIHNDLNLKDSHFSSGQLNLDAYTQKQEILTLADQLADYFETLLGKPVLQEEKEQMIALIALSVDRPQDLVESLVEEGQVEWVRECADRTAAHFQTVPFTDEFVAQLALHLVQARERYEHHVLFPNPLKDRIVREYPLIYDMALYLTHHYATRYPMKFSQEETSFVAFHIGSYLENASLDQEKISVVLVAGSYQGTNLKLKEKLESGFNQTLHITHMLSREEYEFLHPACDLIVSTYKLETSTPCIQVSPFLSPSNTKEIWLTADEIATRKNASKIKAFLESLFEKNLYFRNLYLQTKEDYLDYLGQKALSLHKISSTFIEDIKLRESAANTVFTEDAAMPHTMLQFADESFIALVHNDLPIPWGKDKVHFILMIGISEEDIELFKPAFEYIINAFMDDEQVRQLRKSQTLDEFIRLLMDTQQF